MKVNGCYGIQTVAMKVIRNQKKINGILKGSQIMKYNKQDQQGKAAFNERNPHAKPSYRKKKINLKNRQYILMILQVFK
jgi:hypothetical protein